MRIPALPKSPEKDPQPTEPLLQLIRSALTKKRKKKKRFASVPRRD